MFHEIEIGAEFFFSEEDYLNKEPKVKAKTELKTESDQLNIPPLTSHPAPCESTSTSRPASASSPKMNIFGKRPRRTAAATVRSYAVPDSDDEEITNDDENANAMHFDPRRKKVESSLQRWIKELSVLLKEEQRKVRPR